MEPIPALIALSMLATPPPENARVALSRTYTLPAPAVDVALLNEDLALLLTPSDVLLARLDRYGLTVIAERSLPTPYKIARAAAGVIQLGEDRSSAWVLTNTAQRALLVSIENERLIVRAEADALPWPGARTGVSFKEGTNLLEASIDQMTNGPFLRLAAIGKGLAIQSDGHIKIAGPGGGRLVEDVALGPMLAPLWDEQILSSSARPPGAADSLMILVPDGTSYRTAQSITVEGAVRAIASLVLDSRAHVAVIAEKTDGTFRLHMMLLARSTGR